MGEGTCACSSLYQALSSGQLLLPDAHPGLVITHIGKPLLDPFSVSVCGYPRQIPDLRRVIEPSQLQLALQLHLAR